MSPYRGVEGKVVEVKILFAFWRQDGELTPDKLNKAKQTLADLLTNDWVLLGQSETHGDNSSWITWTLSRTRYQQV